MNPESSEKSIPSPKTAAELLTMYYHDARSHLLETAAILDRIERAEGGEKAMRDNRIKQLKDACNILTNASANRAEQFLLLLSEK